MVSERSCLARRLTALGLEPAASATSSAGAAGLVARSFAHVSEPVRGMDQADPSCGSSGGCEHGRVRRNVLGIEGAEASAGSANVGGGSGG